MPISSDETKGINISSNQADVIGVGVYGNNNTIIKVNISDVINELSEDCGITLLHPNHFDNNVDTEEDFEGWKKDGFRFFLIESIQQRREYRREKVLEEIKNKLEEKKRLLLLGDSGTSKTTLLMEIICDYFKDYKVLYNLGDDELKNTNSLTEIIKGLAYANNKVLVVVDNVHSPKVSLIFNVIKNTQSFNKEKKDNIHFLLAARQPEFDWMMKKGLMDNNIIEIIEGLFNDYYKYPLRYFTIDEIKEFIEKYQAIAPLSIKMKKADELAKEILTDTGGYPIMVRFSILNNGLERHVKKMFREYLLENTKINSEKLQVVILNSLFDISTIRLKEELLDEFGLLDIALDMQGTIIKQSGDVWKTIHPKWDLELFRYIFFTWKFDTRIIANSFKGIVNNIIASEKIISLDKIYVLNTVYYTLIKENVVKLNTIEKMINLKDIENKLDDSSKVLFYANVIGVSYYESGKNEEALDFYDKALAINPNHVGAYSNKGWSLSNLGRDEDAIKEYDKAIEVDSNYVNAYYNKGVSLSNLGKDKEAIIEYDKAIEVDSNYVRAYNNKGLSLSNLDRYEDAIVEYDKALEINPNHVEAYNNKGLSLSNLDRYEDAIVEYDKALEINPNHVEAYNNKGNSLSKLGREEDAIIEYDKALEINPNEVSAYYNKGSSLSKLDRYEEAIVEYDKALEIDSNLVNAYYNKGLSLSNLGRYEEAIVEYDKALEINPNEVSAYYNKGNSLSNLGRDEDAIVEYDKAIKINPNDIKAYNNKGSSLSNLGRDEDAIREYDKALEINPNDIMVYNNKGLSFSNLGRDEDAIVEYDKAIKINSNDADAYNNKGWSFSKLGRYEDAIREYDKALEINPQDAALYDNKGYSLFLLGRNRDAIEFANQAIKFDNNYASAYYNRAIFKIKEGCLKEGLKDLKQALEINKQFVESVKEDKDLENIKDNPKFIELLKEFK